MSKISIAALGVEELLSLRDEIESRLGERRREIVKTLSRLGGEAKSASPRGRRSSHLRGVKIKAKYRGPKGETWAGRGATPRWIRDSGKKPEEFLIKKPKKAAETR